MFLRFFDALCRGEKIFLPFDFLLGLVQNATSQGKLGRRGRKTRLFAKQKCRALLVYKQSYGCFEMVFFPAKTAKVKKHYLVIAKIFLI